MEVQYVGILPEKRDKQETKLTYDLIIRDVHLTVQTRQDTWHTQLNDPGSVRVYWITPAGLI